MIDLHSVGLIAHSGLSLAREDPLRYRRMSSLAQRKLFEHVLAGNMTYWHAGNASGKTDGGAHLGMALCRGLTRVDGRLLTRPGEPPDDLSRTPHWIKLPGLHPGESWRHWVLVQSYDQAKDSSMRAYRKLLGDVEHTIGWIEQARGTVKLIRVRPDGWPDDDPATWSEITFISQEAMTDEDVRMVQGARVHSVHADEMPKQSVWDEVCARKTANVALYLWITATPEYKHEWEWCFNEFRGCFELPTRGRVRIQSSVEDNRALSRADIADRRMMLEGPDPSSPRPLFAARWYGRHVDVSGQCPFPEKALTRLLDQCQPGRTESVTLRGPDGEHADILAAVAKIERWLPPDPRHSYLVTIDPSRGIEDDAHDPCELQVWDWTEGLLVCRYGQRDGLGGYLDGDSLGILADKLGREHRAWIDVETNGGFGEPVLLALRKRHYPWLMREDRTRKPGVVSQDYGWNTNPTSRGEIVGALIKGLNEATFGCWSKDAVQQWADVREAADGRAPQVSRKKRHHAEAMICAGRALHWIQSRPAPEVMESRVTGDPLERALKATLGRPIRVRKRRDAPTPELYRTDVE